jgi:hypothetical protein
VRGGKSARYLRYILNYLGLKQLGPTGLYVDNIAAIMMANAKNPTERSQYIDVQYFTLLSWVDAGDVILLHIPGVMNPSDALTKPLRWVLHHLHCHLVMGLAGSPYSDTTGRLG